MHPLLRDSMRLFRPLFLALTVVSLAACGTDSNTTPVGDVVGGTYDLSTVNGQPLPFVQSGTTPQTAIVSGTFVATKTGSFTESRVVRTVSTGATQTVVTTGQLQIGGSVLTWTLTGGTSGLGSISANKLTLEFPAGSFDYIRQ
jgi:hypothetical protein